MFKKMTVLAMAVGLVAALALPARASASWKHKGVAIGSDVQLNLEGTVIFFQSPFGGVHCLVNSRVKFTSAAAQNTTAHIETLDRVGQDTEACQGTGGLAFCDVHNVQPKNLSWDATTVQTAANTIEIHTGEIVTTTTGSFCSMERVVLTPATVLATGNANPFSQVQLTGTFQVHVQSTGSAQRSPHLFDGNVNTTPAQIGGALQITNPAQRNTYTI